VGRWACSIARRRFSIARVYSARDVNESLACPHPQKRRFAIALQQPDGIPPQKRLRFHEGARDPPSRHCKTTLCGSRASWQTVPPLQPRGIGRAPPPSPQATAVDQSPPLPSGVELLNSSTQLVVSPPLDRRLDPLRVKSGRSSPHHASFGGRQRKGRLVSSRSRAQGSRRGAAAAHRSLPIPSDRPEPPISQWHPPPDTERRALRLGFKPPANAPWLQGPRQTTPLISIPVDQLKGTGGTLQLQGPASIRPNRSPGSLAEVQQRRHKGAWGCCHHPQTPARLPLRRRGLAAWPPPHRSPPAARLPQVGPDIERAQVY